MTACLYDQEKFAIVLNIEPNILVCYCSSFQNHQVNKDLFFFLMLPLKCHLIIPYTLFSFVILFYFFLSIISQSEELFS